MRLIFTWVIGLVCVTCRVHMCDMTHSRVSGAAFICGIWLLMYVWVDSFVCVPPTHIHMCGMSHFCGVTHPCAWHAAFICVTWLIVVCDCRIQIIRVTWLVSVFDFSLPYVWWLMSVACPIQTCMFALFYYTEIYLSLWLIHVCDALHSYVWYDSLSKSATRRIRTRGMT